MVEGIKYNEIIKIGCLNNNIEENLEQYKKAYDVVILNACSMNFVNKLLKQIK